MSSLYIPPERCCPRIVTGLLYALGAMVLGALLAAMLAFAQMLYLVLP